MGEESPSGRDRGTSTRAPDSISRGHKLVPSRPSSACAGISTAPWLFTKVVGVIKECFHRDGLSLFQYLDYWLGEAQTREETQISSFSKTLHTLGVSNQLPEIRGGPHSSLQLRRDVLQPTPWDGVHHLEESGQGRNCSWKPESGRSGSSSTASVSGGNTTGAGQLDTFKSATPHLVSPPLTLEPTKGLPKAGGPHHSSNKATSLVVVNVIKHYTGHLAGTSPIHLSHLHEHVLVS